MVRTTSSSSTHLSLTNKMNHYKSCSGNITTRSGYDNSIDNKEDDTPIGSIIQFLNAGDDNDAATTMTMAKKTTTTLTMTVTTTTTTAVTKTMTAVTTMTARR